MSRATASHAVQIAMGRKLRQHPRVAEIASACTKPPLSTSSSMRSALGTLDPDDGLVGPVVITRHCDPGDADDHQRYWPQTAAGRWRWNGAGLLIDMAQRPTDKQYDVIAAAIVAAAERLKQ